MTDSDPFKTTRLIAGNTQTETIIHPAGKIISLPGSSFRAANPDTDTVAIDTTEGTIMAEGDNIGLTCPLQLPDGVTITQIVVWGNAAATAETFYLLKIGVNYGGASTITSGLIGTEITGLSEIIDNGLYHYYISTSGIDTNDMIYGARIKYAL